MILDEIKLINFGIYKDTHTIQLTPHSKDKPVILIGGQNGLGKTTLLDAFKLVLFGKLAKCSNRGSMGYNEYLRKCINDDTDPKDGTSLELKFRTYVDGEEREYELRRSWGSNGKGITEYFSAYLNGQYDRVISENWHEHLEEIFPADISHLFFFDGEKIEQFAEINESANLLETAVNSLLGLNVVDQLGTDLNSLVRRKLKSVGNKRDRKLIEGLEEELSKLLKRKAAVVAEKEELQEQLDDHLLVLERSDREFEKEGGELYEQSEQIDADLKTKVEELELVEKEQQDLAAGAIPLLLVGDLLTAMAAQAPKEDEAKKERILCDTLLARDETLLAHLADLGVDPEVRGKTKALLDEDLSVRREKAQLEEYLNLESTAAETLYGIIAGETVLKSAITKTLDKSDILREEIVSLHRTIAAVPQEEKIASIIQRRNEIKEHLEQAKIKYEVLTMDIDRIDREVEHQENQLKRVLENHAKAGMEITDTHRMVEHSKRAVHTLQKFREKVIHRHIGRIEKLILESFSTLTRKNALVRSLEIDPVSFEVKLCGANGKELSPDRLSAGERQLLATAMLWGISRAANMPLPTIIDTPLGRLDSSHRGKLVENYFPNASHQVLLLSTDEEITGKYYKKLLPGVSRQYLLNFDEKKRATSVTEGYFK